MNEKRGITGAPRKLHSHDLSEFAVSIFVVISMIQTGE